MPGGGESDKWIELQCVERDICLLYHQLANYSYIMADLYFGSVYELPYWNYLDVLDIDADRRDFIRHGCLVMILAMTWDQIDGSHYLGPNITHCETAIDRLTIDDPTTKRLVDVVKRALTAAKQGSEPDERVQDSNWVHEQFIRRYFRERANEFDTNPYFK